MDFMEKSYKNKTREKIVIIKNKLYMGNINFLVKNVLMKMNGYESFL